MSQNAVLIGGPRAVRQATALRLARRNLAVILCGADARALDAEVEMLKRAGCSAVGLRADPDDLDGITERLEKCDGIAALVVGPADGASAFDPAFLPSYIARTEAVAGVMAARGGGRIVHLVSNAGRYRSAYFTVSERSCIDQATTEGAILAAMRQSALELAPRRIRVNAVVAGLIEEASGQDLWEAANADDRDLILQEISVGRRGRPDEVAAVIEFLASDASSYITGAAIDVNGGWWMS